MDWIKFPSVLFEILIQVEGVFFGLEATHSDE